MAYCTLADIQLRMSTTDLTTVVDPSVEADVVAAAIADADAEIDLWPSTVIWTSAQRKAASCAIAILSLWQKYSKIAPPASVVSKAATWRALFIIRVDVVSAIAFNPAFDESDDELDEVLNGPS